MSVASNVTLTSESSTMFPESPTITLNSRNAVELAWKPFESGVPTVRVLELRAGGLHDPDASGRPWVRFGAVHCLYEGSSDARNGVAPLGRGYDREVLARCPQLP